MNSNKIAELEQRIIANRFEDVSLQKELRPVSWGAGWKWGD